ncbi:hypothetical protein LX32DRAFT_312278 [Colletotrichum zoysiae]|uniref:Transmembrane protein n=1 Tax=Colletotrichum zoysiae TaxID=1216348 RepID=A0AAD9HMU8_9PEZI|nr:hypothetical protein LX32DRAFT_312278 [Colletotrichum zoysiae]
MGTLPVVARLPFRLRSGGDHRRRGPQSLFASLRPFFLFGQVIVYATISLHGSFAPFMCQKRRLFKMEGNENGLSLLHVSARRSVLPQR